MTEFFRNIIYLLQNPPILLAISALVFFLLGLWMAYVRWYVSARELHALQAQQERIKNQNAELKEKLERKRKRSEGGLKAETEKRVREIERKAERRDESPGTEPKKQEMETVGGDPDDLTELPGIDATSAALLNEAGITRFDQLEELGDMSDDEREKFRKRLGLPKIDWSGWAWLWSDSEEEPGSQVAEPSSGPESTEKRKSSDQASGKSTDEAPNKSKKSQAATDSASSKDGFKAPTEVDYIAALTRDFSGENVERSDKLGIVYSQKPDRTDDLKLIQGIGSKTEHQLNDNGVYRFKQIAHWSDENVTSFASRLNCPKNRIESDRWIPQAQGLAEFSAAEDAKSYTAPQKVNQQAILKGEFDGEKGISVDPALGILYANEPEVADDLTEIDGIGEKQAAALNKAGIYRFGQIASWNDHNVGRHASALGVGKDRIEAEKWVVQAERLHRQTYAASSEWTSDRPSVADYEAKIASDFAGESVKADANFGILYEGKPSHEDDLQTIKGVGPKIGTELQNAGVFCFKQIGAWSEANVEAFSKRLNCFRNRIYRDRWISQAQNLACTETDSGDATKLVQSLTDDAKVDDQLGVVFESTPDKVDNLRKIKGVGPKIEGQLHDFGVYRFKQIALWTDEIADEFSGRLRFKGRIKKEKWIEQAKKLHEEHYGQS